MRLADKVYFTLSGVLEYFHGAQESMRIEVTADTWLSEVVLWLKWEHRGRSTAVTPCEFVTLDPKHFRNMVVKRTQMIAACRCYAKLYRQFIIDQGPDHPADVWCDFDGTQEMVHKAFDEEPGQSDTPPKGEVASSKILRMWRSWTPPGVSLGVALRQLGKRLRRGSTV